MKRARFASPPGIQLSHCGKSLPPCAAQTVIQRDELLFYLPSKIGQNSLEFFGGGHPSRTSRVGGLTPPSFRSERAYGTALSQRSEYGRLPNPPGISAWQISESNLGNRGG